MNYIFSNSTQSINNNLLNEKENPQKKLQENDDRLWDLLSTSELTFKEAYYRIQEIHFERKDD